MLVVFPAELDILREMQPLDRDVFNYLAERVDFETGVIGRARRVSYGGMAFDLSERNGERRAQSTLRVVTMRQVRNSVERLIKRGLLKSLSEKGKGNDLVLLRIFWAEMLPTHNSDQKPDGRQMAAQMLKLLSVFAINNNSLEENDQSRWQAKTRPDGITSFTQQQQQQGDEEFSMTLDWQPTQTEFDMHLFRAGKQNAEIKPEWVSEFVGFWFAEGKRRYSQKQWTYRLAARCVDYLRDPGLFDRVRGTGQATKSMDKAKSTSLPDWARPPRDDAEFGSWLRRCWGTDGPVGISVFQTRNWIRPKIEERLKQWRQLS